MAANPPAGDPARESGAGAKVLLELPDHEFWLVWRALSPQALVQLPADLAERGRDQFRRISPLREPPSSRPRLVEAHRDADQADFANPMAAAKHLVRERFTHQDGQRTLRYWQDEFHAWSGACYLQMPKADVRELLYAYGNATSRAPVRKKHVDDVLDALRAVTNLSNTLTMPCWLEQRDDDCDPASVLSVANGFLHLEGETLFPASPRLFSPYALAFAYQPDARDPLRWRGYSEELWSDDEESIETLQEWFGYCLAPDTRLQKALLMVSRKRGGKGTVARVLTALLGRSNVVSPTLASLALPFGLQSLIAEPLAIISDLRLGGRVDVHTIAENLLRITGEDLVSIPRKFLPDFTATLPTRFMLLTNEARSFSNGSGALPTRFIVLTGTASFYGREDPDLSNKLVAELPGILNWSLAGLRALRERGRFRQPGASREMVEDLEVMAAPIKAFLADECDLSDPTAEVNFKELFAAWRRWCAQNGREHPGSLQTFCRDLRAAKPRLRIRRPRVDGRQKRLYVSLRLIETL